MKPSPAERLKEIEAFMYSHGVSQEDTAWLIQRVRTLEAALTDACETIHSEFCSSHCHPLHSRPQKTLEETE